MLPWKGVAWLLAANLVLLYGVDSLAFYFGRPMMTFSGLVPLILANLVLMVITAVLSSRRRLNAGSAVAVLAIVTFGTVWLIGHNSGHNAYLASHLVSVTVAPGDQMPASSTDHMVIVSPDIATTKASQAMATGIAGQRNYSTFLQLGPATLQYVDGRMWYVFPLEFDGAGNKARLHAIEPGYIMVSAEDPNAIPVEHYDGGYSMVVSLGGGQGSEPDRWAYDHGYSGYLLDDPTLEINDQGLPYYTVTLLSPRLGWTFFAPVGVLVIDAHTGQITRYALDDVPSWVDRVYSQQMALTIANWYGDYSQAGFQGVGSSNANRFRVSGAAGHGLHRGRQPGLAHVADQLQQRQLGVQDYRDGRRHRRHAVYTPQRPMGIEDPVTQAFDNASGTGASLVKADHYQAVDLTLHVIYGHLTWMATYEPRRLEPELRRRRLRRRLPGDGEQRRVRRQQVGRVAGLPRPACHRGHRQRGSTRTRRPVPDGNRQDRRPRLGHHRRAEVLVHHPGRPAGTRLRRDGGLGRPGPRPRPARRPGHDHVLNVGAQESTQTMQSFTDARVPLHAPGS